MGQGGDNVSRRSLGKWLQNKIWTLFSTNWRVGTPLWNWVTKASRVSLCHNKTLLCPGLREGARCPSSDLGMAPAPEITGSWLPIQSRVSMSAPVGQNGAILIWYSMDQFLCGFWKQNYFSILTLHSLRIITALPQSWLHSLCCIQWRSEIGIGINWIKFPFWPLDFPWLYWQGRWFLFIIYQFLFPSYTSLFIYEYLIRLVWPC